MTIEQELVSLGDEITYIQNYIDLQSIRLNKHTVIKWEYSVDDASLKVPPMLMLTFVENAFKYGASTCQDCVIHISLNVKEGLLKFHTHNSIMKHADEFRKDVPIGVENCKARLCSLFPEKHSLTTINENGVFDVSLIIDLT